VHRGTLLRLVIDLPDPQIPVPSMVTGSRLTAPADR